LITIVHAPHTSSKHPESHTGDVVFRPSVVVGCAAMYCNAEMMFMFGRCGILNSSHRDAFPGPSHRLIRIVIVLPVEVEEVEVPFVAVA
jgi:hypothetical protein